MSSPAPKGDAAIVSAFVAVAPEDAFEVFTQETDSWWRHGRKFRIGSKRAPWAPGDPEPGYNPHGDHIAFHAPVASRDQFIAQLGGHSIDYRRSGDRVYLRDPDGYVVEMSFPL